MKFRWFFFWLTLTTFLALVYVQQRVVLVTEGYRVEALRRTKDELLDQHRVLHYNVLALQSPVILSRRLEDRDVQLNPPQRVEFLRRQLEPYPMPLQRVEAGAVKPTWLDEARRLAVGMLGVNRQAEAKPDQGE